MGRFEQTETFEVNGSYDNGLGKIIPINECRSYLSSAFPRIKGFVPCISSGRNKAEANIDTS